MALKQFPTSSLLTMFQRLMLASLAILFFAACTEGYPTEDGLSVNPLDLNRSQRLQAMNELGKDAHPEMTWTYRALPGCTLQISVSGLESGKQTYGLQMSGAGVDISFNKAEQIYGVQVQPRQGPSLDERTVLLSKTWVDAVEMLNLVRSFQIGCETSAATMSMNRTDLS